jgi:hypothetical protein
MRLFDTPDGVFYISYGGLGLILDKPPNVAVSMLHEGLVTQRAYDWYCFFVSTTDWRVNDSRQNEMFVSLGTERFKKRMNRCRLLLEKVKNKMENGQTILGLTKKIAYIRGSLCVLPTK